MTLPIHRKCSLSFQGTSARVGGREPPRAPAQPPLFSPAPLPTPGLMAALARQALQPHIIGTFTPQGHANLLWAFATLGIKNRVRPFLSSSARPSPATALPVPSVTPANPDTPCPPPSRVPPVLLAPLDAAVFHSRSVLEVGKQSTPAVEDTEIGFQPQMAWEATCVASPTQPPSMSEESPITGSPPPIPTPPSGEKKSLSFSIQTAAHQTSHRSAETW